jgi:uncharacterized protein (DUF488 family)
MSKKASGAVYTIGYEGIDAERVVELLQKHRIKTLVDARYRAGSRKRGMSKTPLSAALGAVGIAYSHDRGLGTPPEIMRKLRDEGTYDWEAYQAFLASQEDSLVRATELAQDGAVCFMCYEANALECHRRFVANEVAERAGLRVEHIPVTPK